MCETKNENSSNLLRGISENGGILFYGIDSTAIVRRMEQLHKTSAVTTAALGRLLTGVAMMGQMLKSDSDSVTVQIKGGGPAGRILAVSNNMNPMRFICVLLSIRSVMLAILYSPDLSAAPRSGSRRPLRYRRSVVADKHKQHITLTGAVVFLDLGYLIRRINSGEKVSLKIPFRNIGNTFISNLVSILCGRGCAPGHSMAVGRSENTCS